MEKVTSFAKKRALLAGAIAAAVALVGTKVLADDSTDIESFYPITNTTASTASYDNFSGDYPVITAIVSQPGVFSGHTYTGWSLLAQDDVGSLDLFVGLNSLTNSTHVSNNGTVFAVGDKLNVVGQWSPFHSLPELAFSTNAAFGNSITNLSHGNAVPAPPSFPISTLNNPSISNNLSVAGFYILLTNVTITGNASNSVTFPTFAQANVNSETYTITDNTGSMTMFDFVTSDSTAAQLGGTPVPVGAVNIYGYDSVFPSAGVPGGGLPEFVPVAIVSVPEPSTVLLVCSGLVGVLAMRRRRS